MENIIEKAKNYAISCYRNTNHLYDGKPYEMHLNDEKNRYVIYSKLFVDELN